MQKSLCPVCLQLAGPIHLLPLNFGVQWGHVPSWVNQLSGAGASSRFPALSPGVVVPLRKILQTLWSGGL